MSTPSLGIRLAAAPDKAAFVKLWTACLEELQSMYPDELLGKELDYYLAIFDYFQRAKKSGVCLLALDADVPVGVLLWGDLANLAEAKSFGRVAVGYGTYVSPDYRRRGISFALRVSAQRALRVMGFDTLLGAVAYENKPGKKSLPIGFKPHQIIYTLNLHEPMLRRRA